jgi:chromate transport protein ChrA
MLLPGPEAQQLATYAGWMLRGTRGGLVAGTLFVLPGFISILLLSVLYAGFQHLGLVQALFFGIKAAVLAVVIEAVLRIGKRALKNAYMYALAAGAFIAIFFFDLPFPLIIAAAALIGFVGSRVNPDKFVVITGHGSAASGAIEAAGTAEGGRAQPTIRRALTVSAIFLTLWVLPLIALSTFVPCFLWIVLGAPYVEWLQENRSLSAALSAITAAVVGVILNLAVWFGLHVVFAQVDEVRGYGIRLHLPVIETLDLASLILAAGAFIAMLRFRIGMNPVIGTSAALGALWFLLS